LNILESKSLIALIGLDAAPLTRIFDAIQARKAAIARGIVGATWRRPRNHARALTCIEPVSSWKTVPDAYSLRLTNGGLPNVNLKNSEVA
jgi:hypothetical protein